MVRFVALGDSLTEGVGDPHPSWPNGLRGWADRLAAGLATADPGTEYANLALRGKTARDVVAEQLPAALAMQPDIVTIWAGGNDVLRPRLKLDNVLQPIDHALAQFAVTTTLIVFTGFEISGSPALGALGSRIRALNASLREIAGERRALVADVSERGAWRDRRLWAGDRVHPSSLGHGRIAAQVAHLVGLQEDAVVNPVLTPARPPRFARVAADEIEWWRVHAAPHIARWATGASRRQLVAPKWAVPVRPAAAFPWFDVAGGVETGNDLGATCPQAG